MSKAIEAAENKFNEYFLRSDPFNEIEYVALRDAIKAYEAAKWQDISEYNFGEEVDVILDNGEVQCGQLFEGVFIDACHDYINPQPYRFQPLPQPPKQGE